MHSPFAMLLDRTFPCSNYSYDVLSSTWSSFFSFLILYPIPIGQNRFHYRHRRRRLRLHRLRLKTSLNLRHRHLLHLHHRRRPNDSGQSLRHLLGSIYRFDLKTLCYRWRLFRFRRSLLRRRRLRLRLRSRSTIVRSFFSALVSTFEALFFKDLKKKLISEHLFFKYCELKDSYIDKRYIFKCFTTQ